MYGMVTGRKYRVWCADGKVRTATATAEPDTFFTIPGRVRAGLRTVSGSISQVDNLFTYPGVAEPEPLPRFMFSPYAYRRNANALPAWPKPQLRPDVKLPGGVLVVDVTTGEELPRYNPTKEA